MNIDNSNGLTLKQYLTMNGFTPRQIDVAGLALTSASNKAIASALFVAEKTIKFHLTDIYKKLKVKNRTGLILHLRDYVLANYAEVTVYADDYRQVLQVSVVETKENVTPINLPEGIRNEQEIRSTTT